MNIKSDKNKLNMKMQNVVEGIGMSWEGYESNPLWPVLVETVHVMIMYPHHKAYTRDVILHDQPDATPQDLAIKLGIPLGEALVILYELQKQKSEAKS